MPNKKVASLKVIGNGKTMGFTDGSQKVGLYILPYDPGISFSGELATATNKYGTSIGQEASPQVDGAKGSHTAGLTRDSENSGIEVEPDYQIKYIIKY